MWWYKTSHIHKCVLKKRFRVHAHGLKFGTNVEQAVEYSSYIILATSKFWIHKIESGCEICFTMPTFKYFKFDQKNTTNKTLINGFCPMCKMLGYEWSSVCYRWQDILKKTLIWGSTLTENMNKFQCLLDLCTGPKTCLVPMWGDIWSIQIFSAMQWVNMFFWEA